MKIFDYSCLSIQKRQIIQAFHKKGIIGILNVPGFKQAQEDFIQAAQKFIALDEHVRSQYSPPDSYERGWSYGIESYSEDKTDAYKGSYYAVYPQEHAKRPNIWPCADVPEFKPNYLKLVDIIYQTGKELLPIIDLPIENLSGLSRMVYYCPVHNDDGVEWAGEHRDHSLLTGLCPGAYLLQGERISKPAGSGLFIRGEEISAPTDALLFQIGETAELLTNGAVTATEHEVRKAIGGYERYNLVLFIHPMPEQIINSTITKYNDRYTPGMKYEEWAKRSFDKYNKSKSS